MATVKARTERRRATVRRAVKAAAGSRARLSVFRSSKHIYAQVIDDVAHTTVAMASTMDEALKGDLKGLKKSEKAKKVGAAIAERCKAKGIEKVVFDRNGFIYHGRVQALADAAREAGLKF